MNKIFQKRLKFKIAPQRAQFVRVYLLVRRPPLGLAGCGARSVPHRASTARRGGRADYHARRARLLQLLYLVVFKVYATYPFFGKSGLCKNEATATRRAGTHHTHHTAAV